MSFSRNQWPIWKDTETIFPYPQAKADFWLAGGISEYAFRNELLVAPPGEASMSLNLNKFAEPFVPVPSLTLDPDPELPGGGTLHSALATEYEDEFTALERYTFYYNWSYDETFNPWTEKCYSKPLTDKYATGQYLIQTFYNSGALATDTLATVRKDGVQIYNTIVPGHTVSSVFYQVDECADWTIGDFSWEEEVDVDYVLYYLNPYGGFDSFPIEGTVVPSVTYERYSVINPTRNKYDYKIGLETRYNLTTGLLKDPESVLMDYLISSPRVYLHDLKGGRIVPVRVDTDEIQKKTFKNQNRTFPSYEFQVVECQQKIRR